MSQNLLLNVDAETTSEAPVSNPTKRRRRRPWLSLGAIAAGLVLLAGSAVWRSVAVDALVRFPTDVNLHPHYEGTLTTFIDPTTNTPLSTPSRVALAVDRSIVGVPQQSTSDRVLLREEIAMTVGGTAAGTQVHQYVMDRSTSANVADPRAWAYDSANVLDRSGAYWVALPRGSDGSTPATMFKDEIGTTFTATAPGVTETVNGLELVAYDATGTQVPVTDAYLAALSGSVPLPRSLTFDQLKPSLVAAGVPVDEALAALVRVASPDDLAKLVALTGQPIALEYVDTFTGRTFIEPDTGAVVDVSSVVERVSTRPVATALPPLLTVLERYRSEPAVAAAIDSMAKLADQPLPVFEYSYAQTPASADEVASWVSDQRDQLTLAETTIPLALTVGGIVLVLLGSTGLVVRAWRRSR